MRMPCTLGLDLGTQGIKALLLDVDSAQVVARASVGYGLIDGLPPGHVEQDPRSWRRALAAVLAKLNRDFSFELDQVVAVGVSAQQHGAVLLDAGGDPVRAAKLWCDTSSAAEASELSAAFGKELPSGYTASKLLWLARHEPENWARTARVLLPHDYINLVLTGEAAMEASDASGSGLFDLRARAFDARALAAFDRLAARAGALTRDPGLGARLPRLMDPRAPAAALGRVHAEAAAEFGLPCGALVSLGGGDNMMSAIGSGATRPGILTASLGTSGTVFTLTKEPLVDPAGLIACFCASSGDWLSLLCVMNLTGVTEEVSLGFGQNHEALTRAARQVPAGSEGLLWLPYLGGERVPNLPRASGSLLGMRPGLLRAGCMYRAALEGTSLNLAWGFERMRALGVGATELRLVGGAAQNSLWREILAACFQLPVIPLAELESAALGACLQALWCWRSDAGESISIDALAQATILKQAVPTLPDAAWTVCYQDLSRKFQSEVARQYGVAPQSSTRVEDCGATPYC